MLSFKHITSSTEQVFLRVFRRGIKELHFPVVFIIVYRQTLTWTVREILTVCPPAPIYLYGIYCMKNWIFNHVDGV